MSQLPVGKISQKSKTNAVILDINLNKLIYNWLEPSTKFKTKLLLFVREFYWIKHQLTKLEPKYHWPKRRPCPNWASPIYPNQMMCLPSLLILALVKFWGEKSSSCSLFIIVINTVSYWPYRTAPAKKVHVNIQDCTGQIPACTGLYRQIPGNTGIFSQTLPGMSKFE